MKYNAGRKSVKVRGTIERTVSRLWLKENISSSLVILFVGQ